MKPLLSKHILLVFVLWLLACCTAASKDYRRTMWVSTTGEDSPHCILDSPAGGLLTYLLQPCRSLNYALKNIHSKTYIGIACGIHVLEPVDSLLHGTPLLNLTEVGIMGVCANGTSQILCTNGANLAFYNVQSVGIGKVDFQGCGEQLQHSARDSVPDSSTLYFQNCKAITIHYVLINITGPYGRGISFIRYDTSITHGDVFIDSVSILHFGIHGSGVHFDVVTGRTGDAHASLANEIVHLQNIRVDNANAYPECDLTMAFTGINSTVRGDGGGGVIALFNVTIAKTTTRGSCISLALLGRVHGFYVYLHGCIIVEGWNTHHRKNSTTESCIKSYEHPSYTSTESAANESIAFSSIKIEIREKSSGNRMHIGFVNVEEHTAVLGNSLSVEVADQSKENVILLQEVQLQTLNNSGAHRRGLQIIVTGWARRNKIHGIYLFSQWHRAYWGGGGYIEFSEHATENWVILKKSSFEYNHALRGGGLAVVCRDIANQNVFKLNYITIEYSFAELGGGAYITFQDSADNNTMHLIVLVVNNTAHCGGGMFIQFQGTSVRSTVELLYNQIMRNTLLPSKKHDMMGGGVHVDFSTVNATFRTGTLSILHGVGFSLTKQGKELVVVYLCSTNTHTIMEAMGMA